jgi:hypothetical protein
MIGLVAAWASYNSTFSKHPLAFYACACCLFEATTPTLIIRWFLLQVGHSGSALFQIVNYINTILFVVVKVAWPLFIFPSMWQYLASIYNGGNISEPDLEASTYYGYWFLSAASLSVNTLWTYQLVRSTFGRRQKKVISPLRFSSLFTPSLILTVSLPHAGID